MNTLLARYTQLLQTDPTTQLFTGVGCVLIFASVVAFILRRVVAKGQPHGVIDNLVARINAWWIMVAFIGVAFMLGKYGVIIMFALLSFAALREYLRVADAQTRGDKAAIALAYTLALPLTYIVLAMEWYGLYSILIPVYAFLVLPIAAAVWGDTNQFLARTAKVQWGLMICVYCISHVPALLTLDIPSYGHTKLLLIAWLVIVVQGSDVLQYVWGKLLGKHKVAPELSPSKTWEGLVGGVLSATALGASLYWVTPFNALQAAAIAFLLCLMGFFGGLVMSAVKRDRGVKDWGTMIEGHGGALDRLDSIVFSAPVYFHVIRYWWTP